MIEARCRAGKECVRSTPEGAALTSQFGTLCHGCIEDIQACYDKLPNLALALNALKGTWGGVSYEARVSGSKEPPTPLHVDVVDLFDVVWATIGSANGYDVVDLVTLQDGVDIALNIRRVCHKAEARVGFDRVWQRRAAPCPKCHLPTLGSWVGDDSILCTNEDCLADFTRSEYENHCITSSTERKGSKR